MKNDSKAEVSAAGVHEAETRIALVTDLHLSDESTGEGAEYRAHLDRVIEAVNAAPVDVVLIAGDMVNDLEPGAITAFREKVPAFHAPALWVPGNHDVGNKVAPGLPGGITSDWLTLYEVLLGPSFFVVEEAGIRVVGVNASLLGSGLEKEQEQWEMLEDALGHSAADRAPGDNPTVMLIHYPPFLSAPDEPGGDYWNVEPGPRKRLLELVESGRVCAVLSGHIHRGLVHTHRGTLFLTSPPVSFGLPQDEQPEGWTLIRLSPDGEVQPTFCPIER